MLVSGSGCSIVDIFHFIFELFFDISDSWARSATINTAFTDYEHVFLLISG